MKFFEYISSLKAQMQVWDVFSSKNFIFTDSNDEAIQSFSVDVEEWWEDYRKLENLYENEDAEGAKEEIGLYVYGYDCNNLQFYKLKLKFP